MMEKKPEKLKEKRQDLSREEKYKLKKKKKRNRVAIYKVFQVNKHYWHSKCVLYFLSSLIFKTTKKNLVVDKQKN